MNLQEQISRIQSMMGLLKENNNLTLSDLGKKDQEMRNSDENFDVNIDFENQKQLKRIIGDNPQEFIDNVTDINDLENVWIVTQHADNDVEFQNMILDLFTNNKDKFIKKFPKQEQTIKQGIAMLTDRIMVNNSTSVKGYRDSEQNDFSDISNGVQKFGTQGGEYNGSWVPRPIKIGGQVYFFKTPEELYSDKEFLSKINNLRGNNGLLPLEDYVNNMQQFV
jgi:hypothetical protein